MIETFQGPARATCDVCGNQRLRSFMIQRTGCGHWICVDEDTRTKCSACQMVAIRDAKAVEREPIVKTHDIGKGVANEEGLVKA